MAKEIEKWEDPRNNEDWEEKVLACLKIMDNRPTTKSLRKYIRTFVDRVLVSGPVPSSIITSALPGDHPETALRGCTCLYHLKILLKDGSIEEYFALGDAYPDNLEAHYKRYPSPMAETRAEGRCYIKALNLTCNAFEEVQGAEEFDEKDLEETSSIQWDALDSRMKDLDINAQKFFNKHAKSMGIKRVSEMNRAQARKSLGILNEYMNSEVPESLLGYDIKWRDGLK